MRLVTYDRGGARRLGALVAGTVVDLPDAVGHPAFPTTMEAVVARSGGTTLDAAREALGWPDVVEEFGIPGARLLVPILPSPLRDILALGEFAGEAAAGPAEARPPLPGDERAPREPRLYGPGEDLPWPPPPGDLDYEVEIACVLGRYGRDLRVEEAEAAIFGYTVVTDWWTGGVDEPAATRDGLPGAYLGASFGPCVVTRDEVDPSAATLTVSVDGELWSAGTMASARWSFPELVASASRRGDLYPGDILGSGTYPGGCGRDVGRRLYPGALVEAAAQGIGVLRNRIVPSAA